MWRDWATRATRDRLIVDLNGRLMGISSISCQYITEEMPVFATDRWRSRQIDLHILPKSSRGRISDGGICYLRKLFAQGCGTCILVLIEEVEMTTQEAKEYRKALKKVTQKVTSSKSEARKFLRKAGIVTKSGHLTTHYK